MRLTAAHVRAARGLLNLSQQELADAAGVGIQTVYSLEGDKHTPREDTLMRLQAALEERGIVFLNGESPGVRLDPTRIRPPLR